MDDDEKKEAAVVGAIHALLTHNRHFGPKIQHALNEFEEAFGLGAHASKDEPEKEE